MFLSSYTQRQNARVAASACFSSSSVRVLSFIAMASACVMLWYIVCLSSLWWGASRNPRPVCRPVVLCGDHHRLPAVQRRGVREQRVVDQSDRIGELVAPVNHDPQHLLQPLGAVLLLEHRRVVAVVPIQVAGD